MLSYSLTLKSQYTFKIITVTLTTTTLIFCWNNHNKILKLFSKNPLRFTVYYTNLVTVFKNISNYDH